MSNTRPINPNTADDVDVTFLDPMDTDDDEHMSDGSQPEESRIAAYSTLPPPLETSYATITNTQPIEPNDRAEVQLMLVDPTHEEDDNYNTSVSAEQHLEDCPPLPPLPGTSRASRYQACYDILSDPSQILRHAFLGFYTGDGVHTVGSNGAINLRSTDFVWLYRFAGTYGINPLLRFRLSEFISMKTSAVYFGTVEISLHQFVAQVSVHFGMPSSNTHNTDKNMMARYFNMLQPTRRMMFAVYLLEFLDADGSIIRMPRYSTHTPGYTMTGFTVTQRDRGILEFIMETLQEYDYSSSFGSTTNENTNVLRIAFNNNNNIATNFFRPALRELITSGFPLSEKMMMVNYCLENDLFANIQLWAPNSISFIEYVKDVDDDILVVLGEDLKALNLFGINTILEALHLPKLSSTYDIDLKVVKNALLHINPTSCSEEQRIAFEYYQSLKRRRTNYAVQDHQFKKLFFHCGQCSYFTDREEVLQSHQQIHAKDKKFVCTTCNRRFDDGDHLTQHQAYHHPDDHPKPCPFQHCTFTYWTPNQLTKHMEVHRPEGRPFLCTVCRRRYKYHADLKVHMRSHKQERKYACLHCEKSYDSSSSLAKHYRNTPNHPELNCPVQRCPFTYKSQAHLDQHNERHAEGQPYVCVVCSWGYKQKPSFNNHIRMRPDHSPQPCAFGCGESFFNAVELERHEQEHRQDESRGKESTSNNEAN